MDRLERHEAGPLRNAVPARGTNPAAGATTGPRNGGRAGALARCCPGPTWCVLEPVRLRVCIYLRRVDDEHLTTIPEGPVS